MTTPYRHTGPDQEHEHTYHGQTVRHSHPGGGSFHGYYEHPEDIMSTTRYAIVGGVTDAERIAPYLPANYQIAGETEDGVIISGEDNAGWGLDTYVIPRLGSGLYHAREITENQATTALADARIEAAATEIAESVTEAARGSGSDPIAWVTGNAFMPPLRSFAAAERIWQDSPDGEGFARLDELVEAKLGEAGVALECPDYDNALYAVDLRRFEYVEDPGDHETLQQDWQAKPVHADYPHEPGRLHDCPACEDHCHCKPGETECVYEGSDGHNGLADAQPGTPCENCGCAS